MNKYPVNFLNENTLKIMVFLEYYQFNIYDTILDIFPDKYIHLGGDEVDTTYLTCNEDFSEYLDDNDLEVSDIINEYFTNITNYIFDNSKIPILWEGAFIYENEFDKRIVKQCWKAWGGDGKPIGVKSFEDSLNENRYAIQSTYYYLDWNLEFSDYVEHQLTDITNENITKFILGGEAALWCENVDYTNIEYKLWPRASSISTLFYSNKIDVFYIYIQININDRLKNHMNLFKYNNIPVCPFEFYDDDNIENDNGYCGTLYEGCV